MIYSITVYGDPVPKGRPRLGKHGNTYTPKRTKQYEDSIGWEWRKAQLPKLSGRLWVEIEVGESRYPSDLDNYIKVALDALNGLAWDDDRQVTSIDAQIMRGAPKPYLNVIVTPLEVQQDGAEVLSRDLGP